MIVYIDGKEVARTKVKNHESGSASFGVEIKDQSQGWHTIHAIARDKQGKDSFSSEIIAANFADPTPAPILMRPVVNSNSGIERPFIVGLAKNNLEVSIIVDGKIANTINVGAHPSGTASFSWQLDFDLSLGTHKIEALASDSGKLSNNSKPFYWQVGYVDVSYSGEDKRDNKVSKEESSQNVVIIDDKSRQEGSVSISDKQDPAHLTVKDNLSQSPESPVVPDVGAIFEEEERGRVMTEDDGVLGEIAGPGLSQDGEEYQDDIVEIGPGAVVRVEDLQKQDGKFSINTSFVAGVVILAFLLLSIFVWYIQERKDELSDKVVSIFKEEDEESKDGAFGGDKDSSGEIKISREDSSKQSSPEKEDWAPDFDRNDDFGPEKEDSSDEVMNERYPDDFPPPPPPMF